QLVIPPPLPIPLPLLPRLLLVWEHPRQVLLALLLAATLTLMPPLTLIPFISPPSTRTPPAIGDISTASRSLLLWAAATVAHSICLLEEWPPSSPCMIVSARSLMLPCCIVWMPASPPSTPPSPPCGTRSRQLKPRMCDARRSD